MAARRPRTSSGRVSRDTSRLTVTGQLLTAGRKQAPLAEDEDFFDVNFPSSGRQSPDLRGNNAEKSEDLASVLAGVADRKGSTSMKELPSRKEFWHTLPLFLTFWMLGVVATLFVEGNIKLPAFVGVLFNFVDSLIDDGGFSHVFGSATEWLMSPPVEPAATSEDIASLVPVYSVVAVAFAFGILLNLLACLNGASPDTRSLAAILSVVNCIACVSYTIIALLENKRFPDAHQAYPVSVVRFVTWTTTCPILIYWVGIAAKPDRRVVWSLIAADVTVKLCGLMGVLFSSLTVQVPVFFLSIILFTAELYHLFCATSPSASRIAVRGCLPAEALKLVRWSLTITWVIFPVIEVLRRHGFISFVATESLYCLADYTAKVGIAMVLVNCNLGNFSSSRNAYFARLMMNQLRLAVTGDGAGGSLSATIASAADLDDDARAWLLQELDVRDGEEQPSDVKHINTSLESLRSADSWTDLIFGKSPTPSPAPSASSSRRPSGAFLSTPEGPLTLSEQGTNEADRDLGGDEDVQGRLRAASTGNSTFSQLLAEELAREGEQPTSQLAEQLERSLDTFDFDGLLFSDAQLESICYCVLQRNNVGGVLQIEDRVLRAFLSETRARYEDNPFHNWAHAVTVFHTTEQLCKVCGLDKLLKPAEYVALLLAAICHDVEHNGLSNSFHVNSGSWVALRYNDQSVLEQHHASTAWALVTSPHHNLVERLAKEDIRAMRAVIVQSILGTDMYHHGTMIQTLKELAVQYGCDCGPSNNTIERAVAAGSTEKFSILKVILHTADLYSPIKPFRSAVRWANCLQKEFNEQVAHEKQLGLDSLPFMEETGPLALAKGQVAFITYVLQPYWAELVGVCAALEPIANRIEKNRLRFKRISEKLEASKEPHA